MLKTEIVSHYIQVSNREISFLVLPRTITLSANDNEEIKKYTIKV